MTLQSEALFDLADELHAALDDELARGILTIEQVEVKLRDLAFLLLLNEQRRSIQ
jgi:hypothetical protein